MSTLRALRKLILGETWIVPVGVALTLLAGALVVKPLAPDFWHTAGGPLLTVGVVLVLVLSVARGARRA